MRKLIIILSIFITSSSEAITLKDAVETALSKNHELRAKALELEEKKKDVTISRLHLLPVVDLYGKYNRTTDPPYSIMNRMETKELTCMEQISMNREYQTFIQLDLQQKYLYGWVERSE